MSKLMHLGKDIDDVGHEGVSATDIRDVCHMELLLPDILDCSTNKNQQRARKL